MPEEKDEKGHPIKHGWGHEEKGEKYRRDPFSAILVGLIIIWIGALWFLRAKELLVSGEWWQWFLVGLGGIFILDRLIRYASPVYRRPMFGRILFGLILIAIGVSFIYGIETWWPLIVVMVGIAVIVYAIHRARKPGT